MKVLGVIGRTGSGKTTVIEKLISAFVAQGYSVGTLKDLKRTDYQMDTEGKNTFRHKNAGAEPVTARAELNTDIMFTHRLEAEDLLRFYNNDIVLLEGFRDLHVPQLLTGIDEQQLQEKFTASVIAVSGIYAAGHSKWQNLPCFNVLTDIEELCSFILQNVPEYGEELPTLFYEGRELPLSYGTRKELATFLKDDKIILEYKRKVRENED